MDFDKCNECGKITIAPRRWGENVICETCYQKNLRKTEREKEENIRADAREKVIDEIINHAYESENGFLTIRKGFLIDLKEQK